MTPAEEIRRRVPYQIVMILLAGVLALAPLPFLARLDLKPAAYDPSPPPRFRAGEVSDLEARLIGMTLREVVELLGKQEDTSYRGHMRFHVANTWSPLFGPERLFLDVAFEKGRASRVVRSDL